MERARILFHAGIAIDVNLHRAIVCALNGKESGAGGDTDLPGSIVAEAQRFIVGGIKVIEAHDKLDGTIGSPVFPSNMRMEMVLPVCAWSSPQSTAAMASARKTGTTNERVTKGQAFGRVMFLL